MDVRSIAVFGASGLTGRAVVDAALRRGLRVRAFYRPGTEPGAPRAGLEAVTGQLASAADVRRALEGAQAAACVFGPRLSRRGPNDVFCEAATANVIAGMKVLGIQRLTCQTGAMAGDDPSNLGLFYSRFRRNYRKNFGPVAMDREAQERIVRESGLDWVLVRPPRIKAGPANGHLQAAPAIHIGMFSAAIAGDLGEFHCDELTKGRFHRQAVFVVG